MEPVRFNLHFEAERAVATSAVVNYRVYGEPVGIYRLDEHPEWNSRTIDGLLARVADAKLPDEVLAKIRAALSAGGFHVEEVSEEQAEAVRLGFRD